MRPTKLIPIAALFLTGFLSPRGWAQNSNSRPATPGSVNYVEGEASIDGEPLSSSSVGSSQLGPNNLLTTQSGKVEILLTPGVFLRVAENSAVKMIRPELATTEVEVDKGRAMVEGTDIRKENDIRIDLNGTNTKILKNGLYEFDADEDSIRVFKGKVEVRDGGQKVDLGQGKEIVLNTGGKLKAEDFDARKYQDDDFYRWSGLRSGYLAEASVDEARRYVDGGPGWYGPGWYWDPWFASYTFIPGGGILYSPFGWGFYSPFEVYRSPFFYGYYGQPHRFGEFHYPYGHGFEPHGGFHGPVVRGGIPQVPRAGGAVGRSGARAPQVPRAGGAARGGGGRR
jgi:hypothetical protein